MIIMKRLEELLLVVTLLAIAQHALAFDYDPDDFNTGHAMVLAGATEFPFLVSLHTDFADGDLPPINCVGTLVSDTWVITSAHCVRQSHQLASSVTLTLGAFNLSNTNGVTTQVQSDKSSIIVHPNFRKAGKLNFDFALVKLPTPIPSSNKKIKPIGLPDQSACDASFDETTTSVDGCDSFIVAGWGTEGTDQKASNNLKKFLQNLKPYSKCTDASLGIYSDAKVCAGGDADSDFCWDDSGSPLICVDGSDYYLFGVASYGQSSTCVGAFKKPAVYARLCRVYPWLNHVITKHSTTTRKTTTRRTTKPPQRALKTCGSLPTIPNGYVEPGDNSIGSSLKVTCVEGYYLTVHSGITCQEDGTWTDSGICQIQTTTVTPAPLAVTRMVKVEVTKEPVPDMIPWWAIFLLSIFLPPGAAIYGCVYCCQLSDWEKRNFGTSG